METSSTHSSTSVAAVASLLGSGINGNNLYCCFFRIVQFLVASLLGSGINGNNLSFPYIPHRRD